MIQIWRNAFEGVLGENEKSHNRFFVEDISSSKSNFNFVIRAYFEIPGNNSPYMVLSRELRPVKSYFKPSYIMSFRIELFSSFIAFKFNTNFVATAYTNKRHFTKISEIYYISFMSIIEYTDTL